MAGVGFRAITGEVATGTSAKTIAQVVAASNHAILIDEIGVSFDGTSNTDAPILVEIVHQSSAGTMTSLTLTKEPDDSDETLQTTGQHTATAEPTTGNTIYAWNVHPQTGIHWQAPYGKQIKIGGGDRLGVRVTAGTSVNCVVTICGEE